MTEEIPKRDPEEFEFPERYLSDLRDYDTKDPRYKVAKGQLYEAMRHIGLPATELVEISELLTEGSVKAAEDKVYGLLEDES